MRLYETVLIIRQDVSATQAENLTNDMVGIIENGGGSIKKREYWGLRSLAYRIKKNRKGHYILLNLEADSATLNEFERLMRLNEDILRFLTIAIDEVEEGPSIMMQARPERGERGDRGDRGDRGERSDRRSTSDRRPAGGPAAEAPAEADSASDEKADQKEEA